MTGLDMAHAASRSTTRADRAGARRRAGEEPVALRTRSAGCSRSDVAQRRAGPAVRQLRDGRLRAALRRLAARARLRRCRLALVGESRAGHPREPAAGAEAGDRDLDRSGAPGGGRRGGRARADARVQTAQSTSSARSRRGNDVGCAGDDIRAGDTVLQAAAGSGRPSSACSPRSDARRSPACAARACR